MAKQKRLRIREAELLEGNEAMGIYLKGLNEIYVDPRLKSYKFLEVLCHEVSHHLRPDLGPGESEEWAENAGVVLADAIWSMGFRRIAQ